MRRYSLLICVFLVWILPAMLLLFFPAYDSTTVTPVTEQSEQPATATICVSVDGRVEEMGLDNYVASVLLAEMPASFESEALKAQAIAIRTYTLRRLNAASKHSQAHVCTDFSCCQAFAPLTEDEASGIMKEAVTQTSNVVLLYEGDLIDATYFSCSGGRTESALAVWGADVPYLQAQDSPGEEASSHYHDSYIMSRTEFIERLGIENEPQIEDISYTDGGGIHYITIGGKTFSGTELRDRLGLKSTAATVTLNGEGILITTQGYGHRVGMSQYGADAMALDGYDHKAILAYYYPGTSYYKLSQEELFRIFDKAENL